MQCKFLIDNKLQNIITLVWQKYIKKNILPKFLSIIACILIRHNQYSSLIIIKRQHLINIL